MLKAVAEAYSGCWASPRSRGRWGKLANPTQDRRRQLPRHGHFRDVEDRVRGVSPRWPHAGDPGHYDTSSHVSSSAGTDPFTMSPMSRVQATDAVGEVASSTTRSNPPRYYQFLDRRFRQRSICGARGCVRACMDHLEKTGRVERQYATSMIEGKQWAIEDPA